MKTLKKHAGLLWVPALILGVLVACSGSGKNGGGDPCVTNPLGPGCEPSHPDLVVNKPTRGMTVVKGKGIDCDITIDPLTPGFDIKIHVDNPHPARIACGWMTIDGERRKVLVFDIARTIVDPEVGSRTVTVQLFRARQTDGEPLEEVVRNITVVPAEE